MATTYQSVLDRYLEILKQSPSSIDWVTLLAVIVTAFATVALALIAFFQIQGIKKANANQNTLNFLLETESDRDIIEGWAAYSMVCTTHAAFLSPADVIASRPATEALEGEDAELRQKALDLIHETNAYRKVIRVLNLFELGAVGIRENVLDEAIQRRWWADFFVAATIRLYPIICLTRLVNAGALTHHDKLAHITPAPMNATSIFSETVEQARRWADELNQQEGRPYDVLKEMMKCSDDDWLEWADIPLKQICAWFDAP